MNRRSFIAYLSAAIGLLRPRKLDNNVTYQRQLYVTQEMLDDCAFSQHFVVDTWNASDLPRIGSKHDKVDLYVKTIRCQRAIDCWNIEVEYGKANNV